MKQITIKENIKDVKDWTIPAGTLLHIKKEFTIKNPMTLKTEKWFVVKIDNGTNIIDLMPETSFKEVQQ